MRARTLRVVLVVVALLAIVPHLPTWFSLVRDAIRGVSFPSVLPAIVAASHLSRDWIGSHLQLVEIGSAVAAGVVLVLAVARARRRRPRPTEPQLWVMPETVALAVPVATPVPDPRLAPTVLRIEPTETDSARRRQPGVLQPAERESRRAIVRELFERGRSVAEIARITGIGQDAIRATVLEQRTA
jgi:hypothetical protein